MQKKTFGKKTMGVTLALLLTAGLAGCSERSEKAYDSSKPHHNLVYFEMLNDGSDDPNYEIAFDTNGGTESKLISNSYVYEHILKDPDQEPYVVIDDDDYHVFRQPYMIYNADEVTGKVIDKKATDDDE